MNDAAVIDLATAPVRADDVAQIEIDGQLVLAHERTSDPLVLSPLDAVLWDSFDGATALADLVDDLVDVGAGSRGDAEAHVLAMAELLAIRGFVDGPRPIGHPDARRPRWPIAAGTCLGRRIGIGQAEMTQVSIEGVASLRVGSTDGERSDLLAVVPDWATVTDMDDAPVDMLLLRATRGRTKRLQQLFGTVGERLHVGRDLDRAHEAFARTVHGHLAADRSAADGSVWLEGPFLLGPRGITLLDAFTHRALLGDHRSTLKDAGIEFAPAGILRLDADDAGGSAVTAAADLASGKPEITWPLTGTLVSDRPTRAERVGLMAHLAHRWDQPHLDAVAHLVDDLPLIGFDDDATDGELADLAIAASA